MQILTVVAEFAGNNWSAFSPNLPGVYVTSRSVRELASEFLEAARFHLQGLADDGDPIPPVDLSRMVIYPLVYTEHLGEWRKSLGVTQRQVAAALGLPQPRISNLEKNPRSVSFERVSKYLDAVGRLAGLPVPPVLAESGDHGAVA